jgi:thiol-disulfide isomerase/thioredoxin
MLVQRLTCAVSSVAFLAVAACGADSSPTADDASGGSTATRSATAPVPKVSGRSSAVQTVVPDILRFTGTTVDGKAFDAATLAGKPAVLWFWAPWCPRCRAQAEATAKVAADYRDRVTVVGVAGLDKADAMRGFVADQKVGGFPHLSDEAGAIWERFEITEQSVYVILDAKGNKIFSGNLPAGEGLSGKVAELVG